MIRLTFNERYFLRNKC